MLNNKIELNENEKKIEELVESLCKHNNIHIRKNFSAYLTDGTQGHTSLNDNRLEIELWDDLKCNNDKQKAVYIHELGEALYILNKFPFIKKDDSSCEYEQKLYEIFSHNYVRYLINQYNLEESIRPININKKYGRDNETIDAWKRIIVICWHIITHPIMLDFRDNIDGYCNFKEEIDRILSILNNMKFDNRVKKEQCKHMSEIINILKEHGMKDSIKICEQSFYNLLVCNDEVSNIFELEAKVEDFGIKIDKSIFNKIEENKKNKLKIYDSVRVKKDNKSIVIKNLFSRERATQDVWRYTLIIEKDKYPELKENKEKDDTFKKSNYNDQKIKAMEDSDEFIGSIILMLESPHKKEYDEEYKPISPAQGITGRNINNNISIIINDLIHNFKHSFEEGKYKFIICNPVQYQTSLHCIHRQGLGKKAYKDLRDNIWIEIFNQKKIKDDLKDRIASYDSKLIINACTSNLQEYVDGFLKEEFSNLKVIKTSHPVRWGNYGIQKL